MNKIIRIAIDGPGGAGKSTIAKLIAKKLNIDYIDTGAMYRAIGYKMYREKTDLQSTEDIRNVLDVTDIDFSEGSIYLDGEVVDDKIRTPEISLLASQVSAIPEVREKLVSLQRNIATGKSVVMDGRDIGTNVLKDAEIKIFMTASSEERAMRRYKELQLKGEDVSYENVLKDIKQRDYNDTHRKLNPLKAAEDAVILDTEGKNIEQVTDLILEEVQKYGSV